MDEIFEFGWVPVKGKSSQDFLPGDPVQLIRNGQFKDVDLIHGWNSNEGNWFAVYLLEGYDKDHQSIIGTASVKLFLWTNFVAQDTYVRNLQKCGLGLNDIGINTVAFEYGPWSIEKSSFALFPVFGLTF